MIIGRNNMKDYRIAKKQVDVSVGESVRIIRELQEMSQNDLANATGIPQSTISAIENNRVNMKQRGRYPFLSLKLLNMVEQKGLEALA